MHNGTRTRTQPVIAILATVAFACAFVPARASTPSSTDCMEAAEFIGNAAQARENGMSRDAFLQQMRSDFETIRAFPNELRWFVHDSYDEAFLLGAASEVFDRPERPELHRIAFFHACMSRLMV